MLDWIRNLVSGAVNTAQAAYDAAKTLVLGVWNKLVDLGVNVFHAWSTGYHGIAAIAAALENLALETFRGLWHIVTQHLPSIVGHIFDKVGNLLAHLFDVVKGWVHDFVDGVKAVIYGVINTVKAWASDLFDWVKARLSDAWNLLTKTADLVWNLLGDLEHLVAAITGKMAHALLAYFEGKSEQIATWLIRHMVMASFKVADWIEGLIADVF